MRRSYFFCLCFFLTAILCGCNQENPDHADTIQELEKTIQVMKAEKVETRKKLLAAEERADIYAALAVKNKKIREDLTQSLQSLVASKTVAITERRGLLVVQLPDSVLFNSGESTLRPEAQSTIEQIAASMKSIEDRHILVSGHTDNVPIVGTIGEGIESNWELSTARGLAVTKALIERGISAEKLVPSGFGKFDPVASNETPEGRTQNRRVELLLLPKFPSMSTVAGTP